ncbi:GntR family transcriptional regulator [Phytoactinopolyspora limicola]|uniref:GntR family transcriptional regulator n=1 Tax=Phytoactinopolyspora limicola TaxID=2715536 RepID=UPI00140A0D6A|nr:GntR family transcriptional regulator [Phytoactinopolyspora limicola]
MAEMTALDTPHPDSLSVIKKRLTLRTTSALTRTVLELISAGELPPGTQLPTIRDLSAAVGMSRSAVGQAWRALAARGLIESRRRGGTFVLGKAAPPHAKRYESMIRSSMDMPRDLANLRGDSLPAPHLGPAFEHALSQPSLNRPFAQPIDDELAAAVQPTWPFPTTQFLATHGLVDCLEMTLSAIVSPGDKVVVDSPTMGRVLDILDAIGATPLPVRIGPDGPDLDELRRAMISKPAAFVYQPVGNVPRGRSVTAEWAAGAAEIVAGTVPVIEMSQVSHMYDVQHSIGAHLPAQVIHARSYNFFFGTDMRQAVVGGDPELINTLWMRLTYSSRFVSRILQSALAYLLTAEPAIGRMQRFVAEAWRRHTLLSQSLARHGFTLDSVAGPSLWVPVPDEHSACARLSKDGIVVHPGQFFQAELDRHPHVHVNAAAVADDHDDVAATIARACRRHPMRS